MTKIYPLFVVAILFSGVGAQWPELLEMPSMSSLEDGMRNHLRSVIDTISSPFDISGAG